MKSMDPSPGWGLGNAAPAPAGTSAVLVGAGAATAAAGLLGITTVFWLSEPARSTKFSFLVTVFVLPSRSSDTRLMEKTA